MAIVPVAPANTVCVDGARTIAEAAGAAPTVIASEALCPNAPVTERVVVPTPTPRTTIRPAEYVAVAIAEFPVEALKDDAFPTCDTEMLVDCVARTLIGVDGEITSADAVDETEKVALAPLAPATVTTTGVDVAAIALTVTTPRTAETVTFDGSAEVGTNVVFPACVALTVVDVPAARLRVEDESATGETAAAETVTATAVACPAAPVIWIVVEPTATPRMVVTPPLVLAVATVASSVVGVKVEFPTCVVVTGIVAPTAIETLFVFATTGAPTVTEAVADWPWPVTMTFAPPGETPVTAIVLPETLTVAFELSERTWKLEFVPCVAVI
jgi:hypothetical protein